MRYNNTNSLRKLSKKELEMLWLCGGVDVGLVTITSNIKPQVLHLVLHQLLDLVHVTILYSPGEVAHLVQTLVSS